MFFSGILHDGWMDGQEDSRTRKDLKLAGRKHSDLLTSSFCLGKQKLKEKEPGHNVGVGTPCSPSPRPCHLMPSLAQVWPNILPQCSDNCLDLT